MVNFYQLLDLDPDEIDPDRDKAAIRARIEEMRGEWSSGSVADPQQAAVNRERLDSELLPALEGSDTEKEVWRKHRQLERTRLKKEGERAESRFKQLAAILSKRGHGTDDDVKRIVSDLTSEFPRKALEKLLGGPCDKKRVRQWLERRGLSFTAAPAPAPLVKPLDAAKAESIFAKLNVLVQSGVIKTPDLYALLAAETGRPVGRTNSARDLKRTANNLESRDRGKTDPISTTKLILFGQCRDVLGDETEKARYDLTLALRPMKQFDTTLRLAAGPKKLILPEVQNEIISQAAALGVSADLARRYIADFAAEAGFTLVPVPAAAPAPSPPPETDLPYGGSADSGTPLPQLPRATPCKTKRRRRQEREWNEESRRSQGVPLWGWLIVCAGGLMFACCGGIIALPLLTPSQQPRETTGDARPKQKSTSLKQQPEKPAPLEPAPPGPSQPLPTSTPTIPPKSSAAAGIASNGGWVANLALDVNISASKNPDKSARAEAVKRLSLFLTNPSPLIRWKAAQALAAMGAEAEPVAPALRNAATDSNIEVRKAAREALEKIDAAFAEAKLAKTREEILAIAKDLKSKDSAKRIKALEQIAAYGPDANIVGELLIDAFWDKVPAVQQAASDALEKVNPKVHPHVITILFGTAKYTGVAGLEKLGPDAAIAIPLLIYFINNPPQMETRPGSGMWVPVQLGDLFATIATIAPKDKRVVSTILTTIARPVPRDDAPQPYSIGPRLDVRLRALRQLSKIETQNDEKVKTLMTALGDGWGTVQLIKSLEDIGKDAAPALPLLKKLKLSSDDAVRKAAAKAVEKIE